MTSEYKRVKNCAECPHCRFKSGKLPSGIILKDEWLCEYERKQGSEAEPIDVRTYWLCRAKPYFCPLRKG